MPAATSASFRSSQRNSTRLREFDYASSGAYFVTVCAAQKAHLFGVVSSGEVQCSEIGEVILKEWERMGRLRPEVRLDAFVVMPNHVHGIVWIERPTVGARLASPLRRDDEILREAQRELAVSKHKSPQTPVFGVRSGSLGAIVGGFKSAITKRVNEARATSNTPIWQRNYHDRIIRNDREFNAVREYIAFNPHNWSSDLEAQSEPLWDVAA